MEMFILKRDGIKVAFDAEKIKKAVLAAFKEVEGELTEYAYTKSDNIAHYIEEYCQAYYDDCQEYLTVEDIGDLCEHGLMSCKKKEVAKAYILYREERAKVRAKTSKLIKAVERRNKAKNVENSNANVDEKSFSGREKEASADIQKIIALDYVLSDEVSNAHKNMLLYQHDLEKANIGQHNCFGRETKFVTIDGIKSFYDFEDGDNVIVMNKYGEYESAIVHNYGPQDLKMYTLQNGGYNNYHYIRATSNHTWFLRDGSSTTSLKVGDKLLKTPNIFTRFDANNYSSEELMMWCKGFACGDGTVEYNKSKVDGHNYKSNRTRIRLCGEKDVKWLPIFEKAGCSIRQQITNNGDRFVGILNYHKEIPEFKNLKEVYLFFCGLYAADGAYTCKSCTGKMMYSLQSSNPEIISFIRRYADSIGLFITHERELTGKQTNFGIRPYTINFSFNPDFYYPFKVKEIKEDSYEDVWCLETQNTHSFMLAGGIPTGNCLNIDFKKLFTQGFSTRNGDIRPPSSFSTACQLVAVIFQCQSQVQFG